MGEKRPYLWGILALGSLALFAHMVGFVTPGWIILRRSAMEGESIFEMKGQLIDNGGMQPPLEGGNGEVPLFRRRRSHGDGDSSSDEDHNRGHGGHHPPHGHHGHGGHGGHGPRPRPRPGPHPEPHHPTGMPTKEPEMKNGFEQEKMEVDKWMMESMFEMEKFTVETGFGLWYSKICVRSRRYDDDDWTEKHSDDDDWTEKHMNDDDSSSSEDNDGRGKKCRCKKVSTKTALQHAYMYDSFFLPTETGGYLNYKNFGYASLKEHRIENCFVLAFLILGLVSAVAGFWKAEGCRCAGVTCVIMMMLAALIALVPVSRLSHYSVVKAKYSDPVYAHAPFSAIATGVGALFALITALVAGCGVMAKSRKGNGQRGGWYQFNNDMESEKKEKPSMYISAEALPAKPGLYDVCDFSGVKPVEEVKKPEPEEEPNDFIF